MLLPAKMSGTERRERMAIMEAAISSAMHHPNILQVGWGAEGMRGFQDAPPQRLRMGRVS